MLVLALCLVMRLYWFLQPRLSIGLVTVNAVFSVSEDNAILALRVVILKFDLLRVLSNLECMSVLIE